MPRQSPQPAIALKLHRTLDELKAGVGRLTKRRAELNQFDVRMLTDWNPPALSALSAGISGTLAYVFGENTAEFHRFAQAGDLAYSPKIYIGEPAISEVRETVAEHIATSNALLTAAIQLLEEEIADREQRSTGITEACEPQKNKVFVVHGHDEGAKQSVARFLERIELEAIILHEQPDQGLTIIEKFEAYADQVGFAVILLTPDDIGGPALAAAQAARARQNVIFELGYFAGKLGRGRACLLRKGDVEIPTDLSGVIYSEMDQADGWKLKLARELKAAGLKFDGDKVF